MAVADLRVKFDPRADGRDAEPGDLIEFWVRWSCPDDGTYMVKVTTVGVESDGTAASDCTSWEDVVVLAASFGVLVPERPSCPER